MPEFKKNLFNTKTANQLEYFVKQPSHGLLLTGMDGAGKRFAAGLLSARLLGFPQEKLDLHPYFFRISKEDGKSEISIDAARELIRKLSLKVADGQSDKKINRIALIEDAGTMSTEAQNAILKLLEEPPAGSLIILTSDSELLLLPTVVSRSQRINIGPVSLKNSQAYFSKDYKSPDIDAAWRLSGGAAGLMSALLSESADHPLKKAVDQAKQMLRQKPYERELFLQNLSKDRTAFLVFLDALAKVLAALHAASIKNNSRANSQKILKARQIVLELMASAEVNANPRLMALSLAINSPV